MKSLEYSLDPMLVFTFKQLNENYYLKHFFHLSLYTKVHQTVTQYLQYIVCYQFCIITPLQSINDYTVKEKWLDDQLVKQQKSINLHQ